MKTAPLKDVYASLICEFNHWDFCLSGLCEIGGQHYVCKVIDTLADDIEYELHSVDFDDECTEFLEDYRVAYAHWFWVDGKRGRYMGWPLGWFQEKWDLRNPIVAKAMGHENEKLVG